ncbi:MAG TPA: SPOR domain-containing protein [Caldithrix abyssi]|uniref:SPOR domain-containing protein n=1 Tax=Caldithrix abyssi TaxID=187145 RepID=A0A7V4U220_CALAY|nr:SPOR domain-containing protein [Caldithrix abyssi]
MKIFLVVLFSVILAAGCASSKKTVDEGTQSGASSALYDESFDPLSLNDDDIVIKGKADKASPAAGRKDAEKVSEKTTAVASSLPLQEADGYRVQILATKSYEAATVAQQTAEEQFAPLNYKTYISFEAPQYKVRVGDALTRSEAEEIRAAARDFGYRGAFIVRSKVMVQKRQQ